MALVSPVMPISGRGEASFQPIWVEDVADCVMRVLDLEAGPFGAGPEGDERFELAGPQTLTHREIVELVLEAAGRSRPLVSVPAPVVARVLRAVEVLMKSRAPTTWDEAELLQVSMASRIGTADVEGLRVTPRPMRAVLGLTG